MHNDGKVVPIKAATDQAFTAPLARLPVVLLQVRDKAALQLRQGLQALFDNADDTLFEMADKAVSNSVQNYLFEAMRDLRHKRTNIERGYLDRFYAAFVQIGHAESALSPIVLARDDVAAHMPDDDQERSQALQAMVERALARDGIALNQLTLRMCALTGQGLDDQRNPLGPAMLCEYFLQAGRNLGVGLKVKLIILQLFERYVLQDADQLYGEANQLLVATGVLPELKAVPRRRMAPHPASSPHPKVQGEQDAELDANEQAVFDALQSLLSRVRGRVAPRMEASAPMQPISTRDLLRLLSHLQHYVPATADPDGFDLHQQLEQLLTRVSMKSGTYRKVEVVDEDVINLIAMLFEFILADRNLPLSLRSLIGRLQIPMLKVAVLDKRFFSRSGHPARRLLNEIASAAMGWGSREDYQRDALYLRVEKIVQRLLNDFDDDPTIFSELLADFLAFSSDERRRSELLEQRTRDAEEGRARTLLARQRVQQELNRRVLGKSLPRFVVRMLEEAWSQVLLLACLKHGDTSVQWLDALGAMDELLWSVEHHSEPQAQQRLLAVGPGLLKVLREGLASAAFDPFATGEFFAELEALHVQAFDNRFDGDAAERVLVLDEIVLTGPEQDTPEHSTPRLAEDDPALQQVQRLRIGHWIEWMDDGEAQRCKLIAQIDSTDSFIFVNRTGLKVREYSRMALAVALRRGEVRQLDDALLFDRALDSVVVQLRQHQLR
ncbi:DUF1631 domain-containing protein [Pseudomonas alkylphenolica]|uniref:DUF1631 domain-containing protein n=1 Tax=Pseudomonas alkylphenolica TaxID=237609 RepID=UPI0018DA1DE8|nr:DUF1631 domain-containing protein [Pseudomonas alkylphenolica]MBH3427171.1 DUF1631 domain-containing protein [Pseudomonas alkylphenolica]